MPNFDRLKDHHKNQLLTVLTHYMGQDLRHKLMAECPMAYNALCETDIVKVIKVHDKSEVNPDYVWRDCMTCKMPIYKHVDNTDYNCIDCNQKPLTTNTPTDTIIGRTEDRSAGSDVGRRGRTGISIKDIRVIQCERDTTLSQSTPLTGAEK